LTVARGAPSGQTPARSGQTEAGRGFSKGGDWRAVWRPLEGRALGFFFVL